MLLSRWEKKKEEIKKTLITFIDLLKFCLLIFVNVY